METVNQQIVTVKIDDALKKLDIQRHNFVLLLCDAARYITACTAVAQATVPEALPHYLHGVSFAQLC